MTRRRTATLTLSILVLLAAALTAAPSAQWTGTVETVSGDDLALVGVADRFRLAGGATESISGKSVRAQDLAPGSSVTLRVGPREADGRFRVDQLVVQSRSPMSLVGEITRISDDRRWIEVHGVEIAVDARTTFSGRTSAGIARSSRALSAGLVVRIDLVAGGDGALRATAIRVEASTGTPADQQEAEGTVTAISDTVWTIDDMDFAITEDTLFEGDPQVGDFVEVKFHVDAGGHAVADRIEKEDERDEDVEFVGLVEAIGDSSWTISGHVVSVDAATEIDPGIAVGDTVEVRAIEQSGGSLLATRIHEEDRDADDPPGDDDGHHQGPDDDGQDHGGDDHSGGNSGSGGNSSGSDSGSHGGGGSHHNDDGGDD
jgi:hypothetical protein